MEPGSTGFLVHTRHNRRRTKHSDAFSGGAWPGRAFLFLKRGATGVSADNMWCQSHRIPSLFLNFAPKKRRFRLTRGNACSTFSDRGQKKV